MLRGLYSAATSLVASDQQQEVIAENLAQASTPGYRQKGVVYETFDRVLGRTENPVGDITGTRVVGTYTDFRPGALQHTNNSLDVALEDNSFFVLTGPRGALYTRNGTFRLSAQGTIVSESGYAVQGQAGAIQIPAGTSRINIASDGSVTADSTPIGMLRRVTFKKPELLTSVGPTLFRAPPGSGMLPGTGRVLQGFRETSNVQPAATMVQMLMGMRYFEASQRALRAIAESIQLNTKPQ